VEPHPRHIRQFCRQEQDNYNKVSWYSVIWTYRVSKYFRLMQITALLLNNFLYRCNLVQKYYPPSGKKIWLCPTEEKSSVSSPIRSIKMCRCVQCAMQRESVCWTAMTCRAHTEQGPDPLQPEHRPPPPPYLPGHWKLKSNSSFQQVWIWTVYWTTKNSPIRNLRPPESVRCSETSLTGESRFHISTPQGIWTCDPCDGKQTG
jgi:hypothetical protein